MTSAPISTAELAKNKVIVMIDDNKDNASSRAQLLKMFHLDARFISSPTELPQLAADIKAEGKEIFLIMSDSNLGKNQTGERLWQDIQAGKIPNIGPDVIFEIHSGGEVDDPKNRIFSNTSPRNAAKPMVERIRGYLLMEPGKPDSLSLNVTGEDVKLGYAQSFFDQLEYARRAACDPSEEARREGRHHVEYYLDSDRKHIDEVIKRQEWMIKYKKLAKQAIDYGVDADPSGKRPAKWVDKLKENGQSQQFPPANR